MTEAARQTAFYREAIPRVFARRVTLSRAEVAETLGCSDAFVDSLIADGKLRSHKVRSLIFITADDVWRMVGLSTAPQSEGSAEARSLLREVS